MCRQLGLIPLNPFFELFDPMVILRVLECISTSDTIFLIYNLYDDEYMGTDVLQLIILFGRVFFLSFFYEYCNVLLLVKVL